jgi:inhibitor of KinA
LDELLKKVKPVVERAREAGLAAGSQPQRTIRIPVRYDGDDLSEVAERTGHTAAEVIALHAGREYYVYVIGFVPGFAYLGELDASLALPRRSAPRKRVPAGSVGIAEAQTGVYPFSTPGGWHLIGRTDVKMFDPRRAEPALLRVGDRVVFEPEA